MNYPNREIPFPKKIIYSFIFFNIYIQINKLKSMKDDIWKKEEQLDEEY